MEVPAATPPEGGGGGKRGKEYPYENFGSPEWPMRYDFAKKFQS
jgi:hypothetical protein